MRFAVSSEKFGLTSGHCCCLVIGKESSVGGDGPVDWLLRARFNGNSGNSVKTLVYLCGQNTQDNFQMASMIMPRVGMDGGWAPPIC